MANLIVPPGFVQIGFTLTNSSNGKPCFITDAFAVRTGPFTQTDASSLATQLKLDLQPLYDSSWTLGPVFFIVGNDGPDGRLDVTTTTSGTRSAQANPPPQVSYLIKKSTGLVGRKFRGRSYWPFGGAATAIDEAGVLSGAENTLLTTAATAWAGHLNSVVGNSSGQVVLHSAGPVPTPVTSFSPERVVATQRRRLVRRGA